MLIVSIRCINNSSYNKLEMNFKGNRCFDFPILMPYKGYYIEFDIRISWWRVNKLGNKICIDVVHFGASKTESGFCQWGGLALKTVPPR